MKYIIYRGAQIVVADITPEGTVTEKVMGEESVNITFSLTSKIEFHIDDKITVYGKDYFLSADPVTVKKSSREFQYTLLFFSVKYALSDVQMFFYDDENELTLPDFSIMGTAEDCLNVVLANANRAQSGWTKGTVDETEVKNVSFSDCKCLEAISKIADEFKLEYWIDSDKTIHFTERKPVSGYSFEYGKAKGLKDIIRSVLEGGSLVTRLYVKGAEKNLPKNYRGGQKNLRIDVPYLEKNTNVYGVKEHIESFPDIFPRRIGTVTSVDANDPNRFTDADLDFDLNAYNEYGTTVLLNGIAAKVIFQTGQLAGYRFELLETGGFSSATKTFYLNPNKDEKDLQLPSESMRPAVGDQYILEDIMMPEVYVLQAEAELKNKGQDYLDQNSKERFQYAVISDILYFKNQNINVLLGHTVHFKDVDFGLDDAIRITGLQKNIQNPYDVKFELSEVTAVSSIVQSYYEQQEQTNTIITSIKYNAELARRNYLFAREFHDNVFDGEGYYKAENIKPLSIETKMLSLGSRLQQFGLPGVNFQLQNNNALSNTAGKIAHQTIDPNAIREWNISANTVIGITNNFNYIYIKCQKIGTNANFVVTQAQIKVEQDPDFYHFEVGYLSSVVDGYRKIKTTYGFAQLNPAELSIGRISDPTGNNYIDLLQDRITIKAKVEFTSDSPAYNQINDTIIVGGRNLLLKSDEFKENGGYPTATYYLAPNEYKNGEEYTITIWGNLGVGKTVFAIYNTGVAVDLCALQKVEDGKYQAVFNWTNERNGIVVENIYINVFPFEVGANAVSTISKIKLEKGNKATDWTPAPEDVSAEIQDVRDYLNDFENEINTTFSDGLISQAEAISIEKYKNQLNAEKADLENQYNQITANPYLTGTPKTNLQNHWQTYLNDHNYLLISINEAISDGTTTPAEKANVDTHFGYYRSSIGTLSTRFQEATKAIETAMINEIQVGGRNLLRNSKNKPQTQEEGNSVQLANGFKVIEAISYNYFGNPFPLENGKEYVTSIRARRITAGSGLIQAYFNEQNPYQVITGTENLTSEFKTYSAVRTAIGNGEAVLHVVFPSGEIEVEYIKIEQGNKATDWSPAPEDIDVAIAGANGNAANALAQAQNAVNTAAAAAAVTSFMQTTIDGNVVSTGTLQVGNVNGANAGITGVTDRGRDSVRFYAGSNYAGKDTSAWSVSDNGLHRFHHPNGVLGLEIGVKDGEIVINGYHETGFKTYEMSPNRGLVSVSYIPESFSSQRSRYFGTTYNEASIKNALVGMLIHTMIDYGPNALPDRRYNRQWKLSNDLLGSVFLYSAGTHPNNEQYKPLAGYKANNYNRNQNAQDGWYYFQNTEMIASGWDDYGVYEASAIFGMYKLQGGKVVEVNSIHTQVYAT